ncbi:ATP-binding protein [Vibrio sp.]|nr:ATP-binding protein [Vibrio sp.]
MNTLQSKKSGLISLIIRTVFFINGVLLLVTLLQNFEVTSSLAEKEIGRTNEKTSLIVQSFFDYHLNTLKIQQDSNTQSDTLQSAVAERNYDVMGHYFKQYDSRSLNITPDFRLIFKDGRIIWHDGIYRFYGFDSAYLESLSTSLLMRDDWHLFETSAKHKIQHLLLRQAPIIDNQTGEVIASLITAVILNENFSLLSEVRRASKSDDVVLVANGDIIASTDKGITLNLLMADTDSMTGLIVAETPIKVSYTPTYLTLYATSNNEKIVHYQNEHYIRLSIILFIAFLLAMVVRYWFSKQVTSELMTLINYSNKVVIGTQLSSFKGSKIKEFDELGLVLESNFRRINDQEKTFEDLFNYSYLPILEWDKYGHIIQMNPSGKSVFSEQGQEHYDYSLHLFAPYIDRCLAGEILTGVNIELGERIFRWNLSPIYAQGYIQSIIAQGQDITSLVEAEKHSHQAKNEAEKAAQLRADFLARMSHELRTPLNGILGISQLLKSDLEKTKYNHQLDILCDSGEHLLAVLDDILDFSKVEQGQFTIDKSDFSLNKVLVMIDKTFSSLCDSKGIQFSLHNTVSQSLSIYSDKKRLNQILFNLLSNAAKFTKEGEVSLTVAVNEDKGSLLLKVKDTGIGISEEKLDIIFDPFVQADIGTTREFGGSGLGLAIVQSLVSLLGGSISVSSQYGQGSEFTIELLDIVSKQQGRIETKEVPAGSQSFFIDRVIRVLLVEDNHTNAYILRAFCMKLNMDVTWAKEGQEALDLLVSEPDFELIIMDNQLPNMDGTEVTRIIREEKLLTMPILACTADQQLETEQAFIEAGANGVLVKPIKEKNFLESLNQLKHLL